MSTISYIDVRLSGQQIKKKNTIKELPDNRKGHKKKRHLSVLRCLVSVLTVSACQSILRPTESITAQPLRLLSAHLKP